MNLFRTSGFVVGIFIGIILLLVIFRYANYNHKAKTEYDERQSRIRGKAYQLGFYTIMIYEVIVMALEMGNIPLPLESWMLHFAGVILGCTVLAVYSIWKDAYWGVNNNRRRYGIIFVFLAIVNAIPVVGAVREGTLITDGKLDIPFMNIIVLIMMGVIGIVLLIKAYTDRGMEAEED